MQEIPMWTVYETKLEAAEDHENPFRDVRVSVRFTGPAGQHRKVDAFWDGGRTWRVRFSPDEAGAWRWSAECEQDSGLDGAGGAFLCLQYSGDNALYERGPIALSEDRRSLVHADGTPFFWMADTAWNGAINSKPEDWARYLKARREQAFTAIQFVATQWRAAWQDPHGDAAYEGEEDIRVNPAFYRRLDAKVQALNAHGLIAAPVMLWACTPPDPGRALPEEDAIRLARYQKARWNAYQVIWILGGDSKYGGEAAPRWKNIGRAVFGEDKDRLVTLHMGGQSWSAEEFREEPWFDFVGYQSGHGDSVKALRWLVEGAPVQNWDNKPTLPVINMEPNYEAHPAYESGKWFGAREVRRAAYWSLMLTPPAGLTFGHNAIWCWLEERGPAPGHANIKEAPAWHEAIETPGIESITIMRAFFDAFEWWKLRPAQDLLVTQPGDEDVHHFITAAQIEGERVIAYLPTGGDVRVRLESGGAARWFDPRSGEWSDVGSVPAGEQTFRAPTGEDWVLLMEFGAP